jgi:hypothetical protein
LLRASFPDLDSFEPLAQTLWRARREWFERLEALPKTLSHLDTNRCNLLIESKDTTVAVDWSFVGLEGLGADASQLFASSAMRLLIPSRQLSLYYNRILEGFLEGLAAAGCSKATLRIAEEGYALTTNLRWGIGHLFWLRHTLQPNLLDVLEKYWWQKPFSKVKLDLLELSDFFRRHLEGYRSGL